MRKRLKTNYKFSIAEIEREFAKMVIVQIQKTGMRKSPLILQPRIKNAQNL